MFWMKKVNQYYRKINPKDLTKEQNKELAEFIDDVCYCIDDTNNQLIPKEYIDPTPLAKKIARILQNMSLSKSGLPKLQGQANPQEEKNHDT